MRFDHPRGNIEREHEGPVDKEGDDERNGLGQHGTTNLEGAIQT